MHPSVVVSLSAFFAGLPTVALHTCSCIPHVPYLGSHLDGMVGVSISAAFFLLAR